MILVIIFAFSKLIKCESQPTRSEEQGMDHILRMGSILFTERYWIVEEDHWKDFFLKQIQQSASEIWGIVKVGCLYFQPMPNFLTFSSPVPPTWILWNYPVIGLCLCFLCKAWKRSTVLRSVTNIYRLFIWIRLCSKCFIYIYSFKSNPMRTLRHRGIK